MLSSSSSRGHGHEQRHHELSHHHQDSLQIKQNDKFFSRLMSKDTSVANSSSRVYYRTASSSVPFMWESRPGTPKHTSNDTTLPPLTPPPSYLSKSASKTNNNNNNNVSKNMNGPKFLSSINVFPRIVVKKKKKINDVTPSSSWSSKSSSLSSSSSSSSSSTLSWSSSSCYSLASCSRLHNNNNNAHYIDHDHDGDQHACHQDHGYPSSKTCFDVKARSFNGSSRGRYSMVKMKNALRSIVGHGSSGHQVEDVNRRRSDKGSFN